MSKVGLSCPTLTTKGGCVSADLDTLVCQLYGLGDEILRGQPFEAGSGCQSERDGSPETRRLARGGRLFSMA